VSDDEGLVLIVDDDELVRRSVRRTVAQTGLQVVEAATAEEAARLLRSEPIDVLLTDVHLPGMSGLELVERVPRLRPSTVPLVFTGMGDLQTANQALEMGAADYFEKPIANWPRFLSVLRRSVRFSRLVSENQSLRQGDQGELLGNSRAMVELRDAIRRIAPSNASVLIHGESGSGKELVARELHRASGRPGAFTAINCAAIPGNLIESELFGHVRGAHSTATEDRSGLLAAADDGTVLLDEIGDMPLELQAKLLRVLENKTFRPLGGDRERALTARVLAASHRDLRQAVAEGTFRQDLLFRLDVVTIDVPPLRDRLGDTALLTYRFVRSFNQAEGCSVEQVSPEAVRALESHGWPGNVRELRNAVHRAVLLARDGELRPEHLPAAVVGSGPRSGAGEEVTGAAPRFEEEMMNRPYREAKDELVRRFTVAYLEHVLGCSDTVTEAAGKAGMARPNLSRLMRKFGVENKG